MHINSDSSVSSVHHTCWLDPGKDVLLGDAHRLGHLERRSLMIPAQHDGAYALPVEVLDSLECIAADGILRKGT